MTKNLKLRLVGENEEILFSFEAQLEYDEENEYDEGELRFMHPFTGEMYTDIYQCLVGWSEMDEKDENSRHELANLISEDEDLLQKAWDSDEDDNIDYYL